MMTRLKFHRTGAAGVGTGGAHEVGARRPHLRVGQALRGASRHAAVVGRRTG
jgi:hypothetical protein